MADRELDREVSERVLGHPVESYFERGVDYFETRKPTEREFSQDTHYGAKDPNKVAGYPLLRYSSDIGAAWKVVEHMASMGLTVSVVYVASARCLCVNVDQPHHERIAEMGEIGGPEIAPQVICRAAIQALAATGSADRAGREGEAK